jgi:hypothetical protein
MIMTMIKIRPFILALGVMTFISCTTTKPLTSFVKPQEITDLQKFETLSYITLIESGNRGRLNDTISNKSRNLFSDVLGTFSNRLPLTGDLLINDPLIKRRIERETEYLCVAADSKRDISNLKLTPSLDSLLESNQKRFGLVTVTTGFTRRKGNYGGQIAKGIGIGILTLGMYTQTPVKATSTIYAMIVDAKENNIAFFNKSLLSDKEPLDETVLKKQIEAVFNKYFWTTQ